VQRECTGMCVISSTFVQTPSLRQGIGLLTFSNFLPEKLISNCYEHFHRLNDKRDPYLGMLRTWVRLRNIAPVAPSNPMEINASDDGSGATFEPGFVVETLMFAASAEASGRSGSSDNPALSEWLGADYDAPLWECRNRYRPYADRPPSWTSTRRELGLAHL
jgi:hypothetical protein